MFFKNLFVYRFNKPFEIQTEVLETKLAEVLFRPCGPQDLMRSGWVPPLGRQGQSLVHEAQGFQLICLNTETKILPGPVVKERLAEKVAEIEQNQNRKVGRKEKEALKEQIVQELLPKAFTRSQMTYGYISARDGLLMVDASTAKKADEFTSMLRQTLGSLPIRFLRTKQSPEVVMSEWLLGTRSVPEPFSLGYECELREQGDSAGIIRCKEIDLFQEEVKAHLESGMRVTKLVVSWDGKLAAMIGDDLLIKRIRFTDLIEEKEESGENDFATRFDADFVLMGTTFSQLIPAVLEAFGGEDHADLQSAEEETE